MTPATGRVPPARLGDRLFAAAGVRLSSSSHTGASTRAAAPARWAVSAAAAASSARCSDQSSKRPRALSVNTRTPNDVGAGAGLDEIHRCGGVRGGEVVAQFDCRDAELHSQIAELDQHSSTGQQRG